MRQQVAAGFSMQDMRRERIEMAKARRAEADRIRKLGTELLAQCIKKGALVIKEEDLEEDYTAAIDSLQAAAHNQSEHYFRWEGDASSFRIALVKRKAA